MAFTQDDITALERAYVRFNSGEQEQEVQYADGTRVRFSEPSGNDILQALERAKTDVLKTQKRRPTAFHIHVQPNR